jgi:hypothetical protein
MAGLIDKLDIYYPAGVDYFDATSEWYSRDDLRAMLRSDETREALAVVLDDTERDPLHVDNLYDGAYTPDEWNALRVDAMIRVLTGETPE